MGLLSYLHSIYQLDTLDTRLTNSSTTPYKRPTNARSDLAYSKSLQDLPQGVPVKLDSNGRPLAQPSKWNTPEFYFYYFVFLTMVPYMFWVAYDVSRPSDRNYKKYEHLLSPGWVPGRKIDISDSQYESFRENIPYMALLVIFHPLLRRLYDTIRPIPETKLKSEDKVNGSASYVSVADADARMNQRASFDYAFALLYITALHGFSALKIIIILSLNFQIASRLPKRYIPIATWIFNIGTLFANELCGGYKFAKIAQLFSPTGQELPEKGVELQNWGTLLDNYGGIMSRWEILFNITVLRLISYNMDYYWSLDRKAGSLLEVWLFTLRVYHNLRAITNVHKKKQLDPANLSDRDRISIPADEKDYTFRNYVAYVLYAPLYLAGPIVTFNEYISQLKFPLATIETSRTIKYGIRFLLTLLTMELVLHFDYCIAISKADPDWSDYTPVQLSLLSYFNLHIIWIKLLLPWRFFRLWALADGIDPPENMVRCVSDNYSGMSFWRGWHRSYNRWLIRYLYIPLGGSNISGTYGSVRAVLNYAVTFTFVALWHDISLTLLVWGWLIVIFMLPEVTAGYLFPRRKWLNHLTAYRVLCGIGAVGNVLMMMIANLVGFAVGVDGLKNIVSGIFKDYTGIAFLLAVTATLFVGIQVMFELRESEMRQGIYLKF